MTDDGPAREALDKIAEGIQEWVNAMELGDRPTMVTDAVVVVETLQYEDDGEPARCVNYTVPTEHFSLSAAVGLCELGMAYMKRDLIPYRVKPEDE